MAGGAAPLPSGGLRDIMRPGGLMTRPFVIPFILVTSLFFAWGFAYGLLDVLNKHFQTVLGITKLQSTGLQVAYFGIGYFAYSPVAAEVLRRYGYKKTILMGLGLYSTGAILFWPVAHFSIGTKAPHAIFAGFVICTAVTACGLATLEVSANSYVTVMRPGNTAAFRLQFSQSFNGVASFSGPLIASKYFFSGGNADNLTNVQFVYMAVAGLGVLLGGLFLIIALPEVSEAELQAEANDLADGGGEVEDAQLAKPFIKQYRPIFGFVCQFMYVGAQVTIGSFFINYVTENADYTSAQASNLLSYALILFTVGRFVSTALLSTLSASLILMCNAAICAIIAVLIASLKGKAGVGCVMVIMFFESCQYPVIFVLSTQGLGRHTRRAAGLLVQGVAGGAVFPPIQGALADRYGTRTSYWLVFPAFLYITAFAGTMWVKNGRQWTSAGEAEINRQARIASGATDGGYPAQETAAYVTGSINEKHMDDEVHYDENAFRKL
ncbi:hypothetical protein FRB96_005714 [Tulasnella sp. 330]|nr:hypothetical protein FRB96_005714 [Tulasnella sp. 330]KAG8880502.1 hypothetical protein FRB97_000737 [Tulasnella sp. 331]KAG8886916.1 hypothetical protein FRB98_000791 [Tulasnella sp. 332]